MRLTRRTTQETADTFQVSSQWAIEKRKTYLAGEISRERGYVQEFTRYMAGTNAEGRVFGMDCLKRAKRRLARLESDLMMLDRKPFDGEITADDVTRAKQVPIKGLLATDDRGRILCPKHDDRNGGNCKIYDNNRVHCFVCHEGFDTIDVIEMTRGYDFLGAVKYLVGK